MNSIQLLCRQSPLWRVGHIIRSSRSTLAGANLTPILATAVTLEIYNARSASCEAFATKPMDMRQRATGVTVRPTPLAWRIIGEIKRYWKLLQRMFKLGLLVTPALLLSPIMIFCSSDVDKDADAHLLALMQEHEATGVTAAYLRMCLYLVEHAGAAVIKLTQWASSRPDMFGHDFCAVFAKLQDNTTPHSEAHTRKALREAFGDEYASKIKLERLVGSGCIGQVYQGQVRNPQSGKWEPVAVKVLHPSVQADIDADLELMRTSVRLLQAIPFGVFETTKWLNLEGVVDEFADLLNMQLDLRVEASNLKRFNENFKNEKTVVFPNLIPGFDATKDLLVESFVEGTPVLKFAREGNVSQAQLSLLCTEAIKAVCKMIFVDNWIHGDLHPGNVFVSNDGKRFILFDVGIVNTYPEEDHQNIIDILGCFIRHNGARAGRLMIDDSNNRMASTASGDHALDEDRFVEKIASLTEKATSGSYLMQNLGNYISFICDAAATHHVMLNSSWITCALAVKVQEGIALALDPSVKVKRVAIPVILEAERQREGTFKGLARFMGLLERADTRRHAERVEK